jgi:hypothetical protein
LSKSRFVSTVVFLVGGSVVAALVFFNRNATGYNQYIVGNLIGLFWVPMLTITLLFGEDPGKFGLASCSSGRVWALVAVLFAGLVAVMVVASHWPKFQAYYPLFKQYPEFSKWFAGEYPQRNPFTLAPLMMLYAEASYGLYMFCWEFFFRGYLLFGLFRTIGWTAILVQAAAFGLLHMNKPVAEQVASYGAGVVLGIIALNARSFVPCFVLHWAASVTFDVLVVASRPVQTG